LCALLLSSAAHATVFINEAFFNPPSPSLDTDHEFIELFGTPGMKLDGYAIAVLNGTQNELYPLGSIPPDPNPSPEIDEFFSLDGLALGRNGILLLGVNTPSITRYTALLSDSNFVRWTTLWNGGLDTPGTLNNDGSTTILLVHNRPGRTQADPCNPDGLRWGKAILHDAQLKTPVWDTKTGQWKDQWGNGDLDEGGPNGLGGYTLDMCGTSTPADADDDLEIVDEVSFEDGQGWEYDTDDRHVDANSTFGGLPHRHVHALDDPVNFNPDALSRVDYRTKGVGWEPMGNYGEMPNGNNWQDTATEQWIRGESIRSGTTFFYVNDPNSDPNAVQPYDTHVPLWLDDGNSPDYNFTSANTYEIAAGRINSLAVPFIPGDCDRDGVCNANDIAKIAAVFGDDDWIFANSTPGSTETDSGDPANQTRPWDVDATGNNGIEATDLQWTLNFQGDTTGQIVGIKYSSTTPASTGVYLNSNTAVQCTVTTSVNVPSGRTLANLPVGDIVEINVYAQVTAGANTTSGQQNGIMQYIQDIDINVPAILEVNSITPLGLFTATRASIQTLQGTNGDLGIELVNGYTTNFTQGLSSAVALYKVTLKAVGKGHAAVTVAPAAQAKFAASTPRGLKVGHTNSNGNPNSSNHPAAVNVTVVPAGDVSGDGLVDWRDVRVMNLNWLDTGSYIPGDINKDGKVDFRDFALLVQDW
jgi:hypothetical protein